MDNTNAEFEAVPQVVFRPGKKRKPYRHRAEESESANSNGEAPTVADQPTPVSAPVASTEQYGDEDEEGLSVAEVLRRRNLRKQRLGGVGFRAGPSLTGQDRAASEENTEQGMVLHGSADAQQGAEAAVVGGISKRFAPQTGLVGELVNKHMEEYVESELARRKRRAAEAAARLEQEQQQQLQEQLRREANSSATAGQPGPGPAAAGGVQPDFQRVLQGRLFEIDLGEEARARNVEMTERARRRLQGQIDEEEQDESNGQQGKARLGRDGRPLRSRNRRGSDDIKRDQLVEEFLSENRLDVYDMQSAQAAKAAVPEDEDVAGDDRIAEQFRREFMEAMAQRHRRRRTHHHPPKPGAKKPDEILRGPKLGGSRNARAAMRELLLKEQAAKRKA